MTKTQFLCINPFYSENLFLNSIFIRSRNTARAGREQTELSRTIPSFKKKEQIEPVLKNIGTNERTNERETNGNCLKRTLKSGTHSYHQERVPSRILNQERERAYEEHAGGGAHL